MENSAAVRQLLEHIELVVQRRDDAIGVDRLGWIGQQHPESAGTDHTSLDLRRPDPSKALGQAVENGLGGANLFVLPLEPFWTDVLVDQEQTIWQQDLVDLGDNLGHRRKVVQRVLGEHDIIAIVGAQLREVAHGKTDDLVIALVSGSRGGNLDLRGGYVERVDVIEHTQFRPTQLATAHTAAQRQRPQTLPISEVPLRREGGKVFGLLP